MARPLRIEYRGAFYHVMSRGNERKAVFREDADYNLFLKTLEDSSDLYKVLIHAYCLMPNHLHLLIQTQHANLSQFMKRLLGVYTIRFNRKHKRHGHLFQGRYKAILIDQDSYFLQLSRYIHLNPIKAGLAKTPDDYPWSSMRHFLTHTSPTYLYKKFTLDSFKSPKEYLTFIQQGIQEKDPLPKPIAGCFLGSVDFINNFKKHIQKHKPSDLSKGKDLYRLAVPKLKDIVQGQDPPFQMYCLWRYGGLTQRSIGEMFQRTHASVSQHIHRFGAKLIKDKALKRDLESVMSTFKN